MHIGIFIGGLCFGRSGQVACGVNLANAMLVRGHKVTVFFLPQWREEVASAPCYPISSEITLCPLDLSGSNTTGSSEFATISS
ncbi:MAG: hypothetical protein FWG22_06650 [Prolixibacteraceae bacterium]|nr:hypothetical protein [Prolixibacteraceae bacterium]